MQNERKRDEIIIEKAKEGSNEAFELLFKKYMPIVLNKRNQYYLNGYELDDWLQEGRIVCFQSLKTFDARQNVTFGLYFKINFERHVISLLRYQEAKKRQLNRYTESLDEIKRTSYDSNKEDYSAKTSLEYIFVKEALEEFPSYLSKFEVQIYYYILLGEDLVEISKRLEVTPDKVKCGYNRLKRKMKDELL